MTSPSPNESNEESKTIRYRASPAFGAVTSRGQTRELGGDMYFAFLTWPLWKFSAVVAALVLAVNALFACLYMLDPGGITNARDGSFEDAFFFSVQTLATIGYGTMAPHTRYAHIIVTIESILGVLAVGSLAGIAFARLSRPKARVLFTEKMVVRPRNGVPHLQLRIANWRTNLIVEAQVRVFLLRAERTSEGEVSRMPQTLVLVRSSTPVFFLTWTVMHAIDESSPFHGEGAIQRLREEGVQIYVSLTGYDQTLGQTVHAYWEYALDDIVQNARFADVIGFGGGRARVIDFGKFHDVVPLD
jgi:inward rectifier potassium channel